MELYGSSVEVKVQTFHWISGTGDTDMVSRVEPFTCYCYQLVNKNKSFFQHTIDIIQRTGRPVSLLANAWIIKVRGPCGDKHFLSEVTQLGNRLLFFQVMEVISKNVKNI